MDSAGCFFSSLRSLTPSPRSSAALVLAAFLVAGGAATALAAAPQSTGPAPGRADSLRHRSRPFLVMLRSAAVPGWGQLYNHKYLKAVGVVAGEGLLAYQAWNEFKKENDAVDHLDAIAAADAEAGVDYSLDPAYLSADQDREAHRNRKINWIWWGVAAHLLSTVDAFVDAHLATFEADFGPSEAVRDPGERPRITLAVRTRF